MVRRQTDVDDELRGFAFGAHEAGWFEVARVREVAATSAFTGEPVFIVRDKEFRFL